MRRKVIIPIVVLAAVAALIAGVLVGPARGGSGATTEEATLPTLTPLELFAKVATTLPGIKAVHGHFTWTNGIGGSAFTLPADAPALLKKLWAAGSGEIWYQDGSVRVEAGGDAHVTLVKSGNTAWVYDTVSGTATQFTLPARSGSGTSAPTQQSGPPQPKLGGMAQALAQLSSMVTLSIDQGQVAGQDAYVLTIKPTAADTTLDSVQVAFDGSTFVPLSVQVFAKSSTEAVLSAQFTSVDYGSIAPSEFDFTPPAGAQVLQKTVPAKPHPGGSDAAAMKAMAQSLTVAQAQAKAGFPLLSLTQPTADLSFQDAHVVSHNGAGPWAILRYGTGLGTVVLAEGNLTSAQQAEADELPLDAFHRHTRHHRLLLG